MTACSKKWSNMENFLSRPSPFGNETGQLPNGYYVPGPDLFKTLNTDSKVLVVGAGGLGCEILKVHIIILTYDFFFLLMIFLLLWQDLALSGLTDIHVIGKLSFFLYC